MVVYEGNHRLKGRASSACAKYADAFLRISLAWRSSRISRSIALIKARSSEVCPSLRPLSISDCFTQRRSVSLPHPIFGAIASPAYSAVTDRASRVATVPLFHACCRHYPGGAGRCARRPLPDRWQPSPLFRRVGLRVARFEACSAFTRVAARMLAEPPRAARYTEVLQSKSLPPSTAPIATGWSDCCRAGFAPAEGRRLSTAH